MNKLDNLQSFGYRKVDEHARSACSCRSLRPDYCSFAPYLQPPLFPELQWSRHEALVYPTLATPFGVPTSKTPNEPIFPPNPNKRKSLVPPGNKAAWAFPPPADPNSRAATAASRTVPRRRFPDESPYAGSPPRVPFL